MRKSSTAAIIAGMSGAAALAAATTEDLKGRLNGLIGKWKRKTDHPRPQT